MGQFLINGLCLGAVYAVMAVGFGVIYNTTRVFHVAHGALIVLATYSAILGVRILGMPVAVAAILGIVLSGAAAAVVEIAVYSPLRNRQASSAVMLISSLGVYLLLSNVLAAFYGNDTLFLARDSLATLDLGAAIVTRVQLAELATALVVGLLLFIVLTNTHFGRISRAVADDSELAQTIGIDVVRLRIFIVALGTMVSSAGAVLYAIDIGTNPNAGLPLVLVCAIATIIGGTRVFYGPLLGGLFLGVLDGLVSWQTSGRWLSAVTFAVLVLFLLLKPEGLFGLRRRLEEG